uniref:Uncharacterized protein n=1 Tax=Anguilla anguilla TaxID=7936 RepID=A0A0E9SH57_ANGAN
MFLDDGTGMDPNEATHVIQFGSPARGPLNQHTSDSMEMG